MATKPQARLTSSLLARKGRARPSASADGFSLPPQVDRSNAEDGPASGGRPPYAAAASPAESHAPAPETGPDSAAAAEAPSPTARKVFNGGPESLSQGSERPDPSRTGRIALTLRVDQTRHKRLKLLAAQTRRSSQEILMAALDAYLEAAASDMPYCDCLRPIEDCAKNTAS